MAWLFSLGFHSVIGIETVIFTFCKYKIHERTSTRCYINIRPIWNCQNSQSAPWMRGIKNKKKELLISESYEYTCDWAAYLWLRGNDSRVPPLPPYCNRHCTSNKHALWGWQWTQLSGAHYLERENSHTADFRHSVFYRPDLKFRVHFFFAKRVLHPLYRDHAKVSKRKQNNSSNNNNNNNNNHTIFLASWKVMELTRCSSIDSRQNQSS